MAGGSWRAHLEYAETTCDFLADPPQFGCAYTNSIYTTGYRYLGRVLGHSIDADAESLGGGVLFVDARGRRWEALVRDVKLNRAGVAPGNLLADAPAKVFDVALGHESSHAWGTIGVSLGYADVDATGTVAVEDGWRGFLTWRHELR
jgi:hypothetical protein